ncbi:MAG: 50S ribosomal protein L9 [Buchnera aphidicola (Nurudea yanoniella)]
MQKIILLVKIEKLGNFGDIIKVKSGYARNFLIPYKKALSATKFNIESVLKKKIELEEILLEKLSLAKSRIQKIQIISQPIIIYSKSRKEGKLFGSVGSRDISEVLSKLSGIEIKRREIYLPNGIFRKTGKYNVIFRPHNDVETVIVINILSKE